MTRILGMIKFRLIGKTTVRNIYVDFLETLQKGGKTETNSFGERQEEDYEVNLHVLQHHKLQSCAWNNVCGKAEILAPREIAPHSAL